MSIEGELNVFGEEAEVELRMEVLEMTIAAAWVRGTRDRGEGERWRRVVKIRHLVIWPC
jgi:hypothetical protein